MQETVSTMRVVHLTGRKLHESGRRFRRGDERIDTATRTRVANNRQQRVEFRVRITELVAVRVKCSSA